MDEKALFAQYLQQLAEITKMLQSSGAGQFAQLGGIALPQQQKEFQVPNYLPDVGQPSGPMGMPQGVMFGGGSPFPVDFGPSRLHNTLTAIRDIVSAVNEFKNSPLGQKAFGGSK